MGDELKWLHKEGGGRIFENPLSRKLAHPIRDIAYISLQKRRAVLTQFGYLSFIPLLHH